MREGKEKKGDNYVDYAAGKKRDGNTYWRDV